MESERVRVCEHRDGESLGRLKRRRVCAGCTTQYQHPTSTEDSLVLRFRPTLSSQVQKAGTSQAWHAVAATVGTSRYWESVEGTEQRVGDTEDTARRCWV